MTFQLEYRGYRGSAWYDPGSEQHHGLLLDIPDRILYETHSAEGPVANFEAATDEYIELLSEADVEVHEWALEDVREISLIVIVAFEERTIPMDVSLKLSARTVGEHESGPSQNPKFKAKSALGPHPIRFRLRPMVRNDSP